MPTVVSNVTKESERVYTVDGVIGALKYYGYTEEEACRQYSAEVEYKKFKRGDANAWN